MPFKSPLARVIVSQGTEDAALQEVIPEQLSVAARLNVCALGLPPVTPVKDRLPVLRARPQLGRTESEIPIVSGSLRALKPACARNTSILLYMPGNRSRLCTLRFTELVD